MKSKLLAGCFVAALGTVAFASTASATTYTYNGVSVPIGVTATVTPPNEGAYVGQIKLNGSGANAGSNAYLYCLDLYDNLAGSGTFTLNGVSANAGATIPHAANSGGSNLTLTAFQVQQIGALISNGFDGSLGATNNATNQAFSAATQLAIWNVEYGAGTYTYGGGAVNLTGVSPGADVAGLTSEYNSLMSQITTAGSGYLAQTYDVTVYVPNSTDSQDLSFASVHVNVNPTPLPAALPLFASGMAGLGLLGWRRKKRKVSMASA